MFKYRSLKKYSKKLLPRLNKRYGIKESYSASEVRTTVYKCNFKAQYLPLGYMLALSENDWKDVFLEEFPGLCPKNSKNQVLLSLAEKNYKDSKAILKKV